MVNKDLSFPYVSHIIADLYKIRLAKRIDAKLLVNYALKNKSFHKPWEPLRAASFYNLASWQKRLAQLEKIHAYKMGFYFVILNLDESKVIGVISFSQIVKDPLYKAVLGYSLDKDYQGRGIMTMGCTRAIDWLFVELNLHRIEAFYIKENTKSSKVLERLDFNYEGVASQAILIDKRWQDHMVMAKINSQWSFPAK